MFSCVLIASVGVLGLFHRPGFDLDESEEFSGVINVKANNKAKHDSDADYDRRMREQFNHDSA